jgi:hypothetical protein
MNFIADLAYAAGPTEELSTWTWIQNNQTMSFWACQYTPRYPQVQKNFITAGMAILAPYPTIILLWRWLVNAVCGTTSVLVDSVWLYSLTVYTGWAAGRNILPLVTMIIYARDTVDRWNKTDITETNKVVLPLLLWRKALSCCIMIAKTVIWWWWTTFPCYWRTWPAVEHWWYRFQELFSDDICRRVCFGAG